MKQQLTEAYHNLLELDRQIIRYLNKIEAEQKLVEKVRRIKIPEGPAGVGAAEGCAGGDAQRGRSGTLLPGAGHAVERAGAGDIAPMPGASGKWVGAVCETGAAGAGNGVASRLGGV